MLSHDSINYDLMNRKDDRVWGRMSQFKESRKGKSKMREKKMYDAVFN